MAEAYDGANESNGTAAEPPASRNGAAASSNGTAGAHNNGSLFWNRSLSGLLAERRGELTSFHPPLPAREEQNEQVSGLLDDLETTAGGPSPRTWNLRWTYRTRAQAAQQELEDLLRETQTALREEGEDEAGDDTFVAATAEDPTLSPTELRRRLDTTRRDLRAALARAHRRFADSAARAGLIVDVAHVSPRTLEAALDKSAPTLEMMAGQQGVSPVNKEKPSWLAAIPGGFARLLFGFLAPLVSGFMVALCLGTMVGLVNLENLEGSDPSLGDYLPFGIAALLGFVIVSLLGEVFYNVVASLSRALERGRGTVAATAAAANAAVPGEVAPAPVPRYAAGAAVVGFLLLVALGLAAAEIITEAEGLKLLHQRAIADINERYDTNYRMLARWQYLFIGALISGPYLGYKASRAWAQAEEKLRGAALLFNRHERLQQARRNDPNVQAALAQAYRIERLQTRLHAFQTRLDEAREAAVSEAALLHEQVEQVIGQATERFDADQADARERRRTGPSGALSFAPRRPLANPNTAANNAGGNGVIGAGSAAAPFSAPPAPAAATSAPPTMPPDAPEPPR